ncbi:MAG: CsbD family protein [Nitrososphaerales archaeon]
MSTERIEGKERKEHGKAEEKIGKEFDDEDRKMAGKAEKEYGKAEEKVGKEKEKEMKSMGY